MSSKDLLKNYKKDVATLRENAKGAGITDAEIDAIQSECFRELKAQNSKKAQTFCHFLGYFCLALTILSVCSYVLLRVHQPTSSIVLRNVQGLTYPTLRVLRLAFVPILRLFPSITDIYDETCLVENPYFFIPDMECWPCESTSAVLNLTKVDENLFKSGAGAPFVVKTDQNEVTLETLQTLYESHKSTFDMELRRFKSSNSSISTPTQLFNNMSSKLHVLWRMNKMATARAIRSIFPKPSFLPERSGQSVERYVLIDGAKAEAYLLPNTECSYVFLVQGSGERTVVLKPARECAEKCRTVSVVLKKSHVLWYNWWYWRPVSLPARNSTETSIGYLNSYC